MPSKRSKSSGRKLKSEHKATPKKPLQKRRTTKERNEDASDARRFVRDLLVRGEAVNPKDEGELPPGATHVIVEENDDDLPTVKRERFSLY